MLHSSFNDVESVFVVEALRSWTFHHGLDLLLKLQVNAAFHFLLGHMLNKVVIDQSLSKILLKVEVNAILEVSWQRFDKFINEVGSPHELVQLALLLSL